MGNPRACASSSSAKVESPRMLIRSIGSICTATFKPMTAAARVWLAGKSPANGVYRTEMVVAESPEECVLGSRARVEGGDEVARPSSRQDEHHIEPDFRIGLSGMGGEPGLGRRGDPAALAFGHGFCRVVELPAGLHLDEDENAAASRHDVDLAHRALPAPSQDAVTLEEEQERGATFGRKSAAKRGPPLRAGTDVLRPRRRRAVNPPGHARSPPAAPAPADRARAGTARLA